MTELRVRDPFKPNKRQREFFEACDDPEIDEVLFDGSIRAGKTQACCKKIVAWAWQHGGRYLIARKTYRELRDSTQAVLLRGEGNLPPALPHQLLKGDSLDKAYKGQDETVFLKNGAEIMFRSLENREDARAKLRNLSLNAVFIDQVEELEDDEDGELYEELLGRLSDPRGPGKMILAANPGPIDHWVHRRFVDEDTKKQWTKRIHVTLFDNERNLDRKYVEGRLRTEKTNPDYFKRFILGEWGSFGGKRFKVWDGDRHLIDPFDIPPHWEIFEGIDYGYQHPFCCVWVAVAPNRRWYVFAEHYEADRALSYHARRIKEIRHDLKVAPSVTWIDPSTTRMDRGFESVQLELSDLGIYTARAENERIGGWARMDEMLTVTLEDGLPWLQVFNHCKNLIREIPSAKMKEGTDDIEKRHDHALDALRYAIMSRPPIPPEEVEPDDDDLRQQYARDLLNRAEIRNEEELYMGV